MRQGGLGFADNRVGTVLQGRLQETAINSPKGKQIAQLQTLLMGQQNNAGNEAF